MQRRPAAPNEAPAMALRVCSLLASGRMMAWFFAPIMHCARLPLRVARLYTCVPTLGAHERYGLDVRVVADGVHGHFAAVDHVQHAGRNTGFQRQLAQAHGHHGVLLGGLEHEGVARGDGHGEHPQRIMAGS